jgi:hypothetical protein
VTELLELCAIFTVVYLLDCGVVVPRRTVGFVRFVGRWRVQRPFCPNSAWASGALFGNPLPPLPPLLIVEPLPLHAGPDGVTFDGLAAKVRFVRWSELGEISVTGTRLEIGGEAAAVLATRRGASALARVLREVAALEPGARLQRLERLLDQRFDAGVVKQRLAVFQKQARMLSVVTNVLFIALFVGLAALVRLPLVVILVPVLTVVATAWIAAPLLTELRLRSSRWLRPEWRPEASKRVLTALTPLGAIRSVDLLARELFGDLDPLAVASALLPRVGFVAAARPRLVELRFGRGAPAGTQPDAAWWRSVMRARIEQLLRSRGIDVETLIAAPARNGPQVASWCPSCLAQYDADHHQDGCNNAGCDCIPLVRYAGGDAR